MLELIRIYRVNEFTGTACGRSRHSLPRIIAIGHKFHLCALVCRYLCTLMKRYLQLVPTYSRCVKNGYRFDLLSSFFSVLRSQIFRDQGIPNSRESINWRNPEESFNYFRLKRNDNEDKGIF